MTAKFHRIRFYPKVWSSFDLIEPCTKPKWCCGCEFKHPFCEEFGKVIEPAALSAARQPEVKP